METNVEKNSGTSAEKPSLFGVITSPSVQFERIRERPAVWGPLLIVAAIIIVGAVLQSLGTDYSELLKSQDTQGLSAEQKGGCRNNNQIWRNGRRYYRRYRSIIYCPSYLLALCKSIRRCYDIQKNAFSRFVCLFN